MTILQLEKQIDKLRLEWINNWLISQDKNPKDITDEDKIELYSTLYFKEQLKEKR